MNLLNNEVALRYLVENDPDLTKSLQLAFEEGYRACDMDVSVLARLHFHDKITLQYPVAS